MVTSGKNSLNGYFAKNCRFVWVYIGVFMIKSRCVWLVWWQLRLLQNLCVLDVVACGSHFCIPWIRLGVMVSSDYLCRPPGILGIVLWHWVQRWCAKNYGNYGLSTGCAWGDELMDVREHVGPSVFILQELMSLVRAWVSCSQGGVFPCEEYVSDMGWHILFPDWTLSGDFLSRTFVDLTV